MDGRRMYLWHASFLVFRRPVMSQPEIVTAERLRHHVEHLAGEIGERNIFRPAALAAAREYIEAEWREQGYQVSLQWYETSGHPCAISK
jgi:hypothetical protein